MPRSPALAKQIPELPKSCEIDRRRCHARKRFIGSTKWSWSTQVFRCRSGGIKKFVRSNPLLYTCKCSRLTRAKLPLTNSPVTEQKSGSNEDPRSLPRRINQEALSFDHLRSSDHANSVGQFSGSRSTIETPPCSRKRTERRPLGIGETVDRIGPNGGTERSYGLYYVYVRIGCPTTRTAVAILKLGPGFVASLLCSAPGERKDATRRKRPVGQTGTWNAGEVDEEEEEEGGGYGRGWLLAHWADVQIRRDVSVDYVKAPHLWVPELLRCHFSSGPGATRERRAAERGNRALRVLSSTSAPSILLNGRPDTSYARTRRASPDRPSPLHPRLLPRHGGRRG